MAMLFKNKTCTFCGEPFNLNACLDGKHWTCPACDRKRRQGAKIPNEPPVVVKKKTAKVAITKEA